MTDRPLLSMQPNVKRVYLRLLEAGPQTMPELYAAFEDRPHNSVRYSVQILRQACLVRTLPKEHL